MVIINRRFIICKTVKNRNFIQYFMEIRRQRRHWHIDVFCDAFVNQIMKLIRPGVHLYTGTFLVLSEEE